MAVGTHLYSWVERGTVSQSCQYITGFNPPYSPAFCKVSLIGGCRYPFILLGGKRHCFTKLPAHHRVHPTPPSFLDLLTNCLDHLALGQCVFLDWAWVPCKLFPSLSVCQFFYLLLIFFSGLSNFNSKQVDDILSKSRIKPAVLQVECHPYFNQAQLIEHCRKREIVGAFKHSTLNNSSRGKQFICVSRQSILDITGSNEKTLKFLYILYVRIRI